jgi:hypothetical protein
MLTLGFDPSAYSKHVPTLIESYLSHLGWRESLGAGRIIKTGLDSKDQSLFVEMCC